VGDVHTLSGKSIPSRIIRNLPFFSATRRGPRISERQTPGMKQARRHRDDANLSALHIEDTGAGVEWWRLLTLDRKRENDHGGCRSS
jgi:hypothetical protein